MEDFLEGSSCGAQLFSMWLLKFCHAPIQESTLTGFVAASPVPVFPVSEPLPHAVLRMFTGGVMDRVVSQLLAEIDGVQVCASPVDSAPHRS